MKDFLSNRQISFLVFSSIVGYGIINLPKHVAENGGHDGWINLIIATLFIIIFANIMYYLNIKNKNMTFCEYSKLIVGKKTTFIFSLFYILYFTLISSALPRIYSETIKIVIFPKTSIKVILFLFYFVIYYAVSKGLKPIARLCEFYGTIIILGIVFLHSLMLSQGKLINAKPFITNFNVLEYLKNTIKIMVPFLGIEVMILIPFTVKNKNANKYITIILLTICGLYIYMFETVLSVMGIEEVVRYDDIVLVTLRTIVVMYLDILTRLDGLFLTIWTMSVLTTAMIATYGVTYFLSNYIKTLKKKNICIICTACLYFFSLISPNLKDAQNILIFAAFLSIFTMIVIPVILIIVMKVKKGEKK